jgi:hypothetical protein
MLEVIYQEILHKGHGSESAQPHCLGLAQDLSAGV